MSRWTAKNWERPSVYGNDRVFAYVRLDSAPDAAQDAKVAALEQAGHPVVRISLADIYDLGQEFFRWEIATAVAGSIIGINAFNQPDVEASKIATRNLTTEYEKTGSLPARSPFLRTAASNCLPIPRMPMPWRRPQAATNRWPAICALISSAWARATTLPCWPTSR